jgi:cytochrome c oxidase subunit 2
MPLFDPATVQGQTMRGDWAIFLAASVVIGVIVYALILAPLVLWLRRSDALPRQFSRNAPIEIGSAALSLLIVVGLFYVTYGREMRVDAIVAHPFATVDVTAFRWSWRFTYPGTRVSIVGTPQNPPELVLPQDQTTRIVLRTSDVNHPFWVPAFLYKRDAIPGKTNQFDVTPVRAGVFRGHCTQFCGLDHALMTFTVRVVPAGEYRRWLATGGPASP